MLAIPFLPSLLSRDALAATAPKRGFFILSGHGAAFPAYLYPSRTDSASNIFYCPPDSEQKDRPHPNLSEYLDVSRTALNMSVSQLYAGHMIRQAALAGSIYSSNGRTGISPMLSSSNPSQMSASLVNKMHLHQGLDVPNYYGHWRGHYGNPATDDDPNINATHTAIPSIDQLLANSSKVYPSNSFTRRSIEIGPSDEISHTYNNSSGFSNPSSGAGIRKIAGEKSLKAIFDSLFGNYNGGGGGSTTTTTVDPQTLVVDKVLSRWKSLRNGAFGDARRLSMDDRNRVDAFLQNIFEIQRRLTPPVVTTTNSCTKPSSSNEELFERYISVGDDNANFIRVFSLANSIIAAAFACDLTRIGSASLRGHNAFNYSGDPHEDIWHHAYMTRSMSLIVPHYQVHFQASILDLANKLDGYKDSDGKTVLDNSLVAWTHESGPESHHNDSTPLIAFGGLGGVFNTGKYYDYRKLDAYTNNPGRFPGIQWSQFLVSVLKGFGLSEGDYRAINNNQIGYSDTSRPGSHYNNAKFNNNTSQIDADAGKPLPLSTNLG
jgi:hypothetical protein